MSKIVYLRGDATSPQGKGVKIICHICNDLGGWGKGFVLAISKRWPEPEADYRQWHRDKSANDFQLGAVRIVPVEKYIHVANMVAQRGLKSSRSGPPIRYDALKECLATVGVKASVLGASIHMPRIGCGLAGGKWERVEPLIESELIALGLSVSVYDYG